MGRRLLSAALFAVLGFAAASPSTLVFGAQDNTRCIINKNGQTLDASCDISFGGHSVKTTGDAVAILQSQVTDLLEVNERQAEENQKLRWLIGNLTSRVLANEENHDTDAEDLVQAKQAYEQADDALELKIAEVQTAKGERGLPGPRGHKGEEGAKGERGTDGNDGTPGTDGAKGAQGEAPPAPTTTTTAPPACAGEEVVYDGTPFASQTRGGYTKDVFGCSPNCGGRWETTSGSGNGDQWLGYAFPSPRKIVRWDVQQYGRSDSSVSSGCGVARKAITQTDGRRIADFCDDPNGDRQNHHCSTLRIEYSDDGSSWTAAGTYYAQILDNEFNLGDVGAHTQWRMACVDASRGRASENWQLSMGGVHLYECRDR